MWDNATRDFGQWPIGWTAASFLVKDPLVLSGDLQVEKLERVNGMLEATMSQARKPQEGKVIVRLAENPAAAARLDHRRQPRQPRHRLAVGRCRPACSWPIRCSRTKVGR